MFFDGQICGSETVRLGFFVENVNGLIYSTYESPELHEGLLELRPGERKEIRLKQPFPGISRDGNVLWFDVRSAGSPAKVLFRTRLIRFHSLDGGEVIGWREKEGIEGPISFRERRLDVIETMRPPRRDFEFLHYFCPHTKRLAAVIDRAIHGASEDTKHAVEVKVMVMKNNIDEDLVAKATAPFRGDFACLFIDLPDLVDGERYKLTALLFDANRRIVGERRLDPAGLKMGKGPLDYTVEEWLGTKIGLEDEVWEPFSALRYTPEGFETLCHRFALDQSGLPRQIEIKADVRDLPLEKRGADAASTSDELRALGRGPQLRTAMRFEAVIGGARVAVKTLKPHQRVREGKSEAEYVSGAAASRSGMEINGMTISII